MGKKHTEFGIYCIKLRAEKGWNQKNVAERAGCTQAYISDIESGKTIPDLKVLIKIMRAYELKWLDKKEFFSKALKSFKENESSQVKKGIIPDELLCDFIGCYLAADGCSNYREQIEVMLKCIEQMTEALMKIKSIPFIVVPEKEVPKKIRFWDDPLSPPSEK